MKNRSFLMLISLFLALATAGAALYWLKTQGSDSVKPVEKTEIWTAKEDIPAGTQIDEKMLVKMQIPKEQFPAGVYTDSKEIVGRYAKDTILKGENFPKKRLYSEEDRLLSMRLEPGYRAFSISMTKFSGVADLIKSGDRVDIFLFLKEIKRDDQQVRSDIAQILLQDVEVLAVRKEIQKDSPPPEQESDLYAITMAVPVKSVEKLILAEETGILKIALRPFGETSTYTSYGVVWQELLLDPNLKIRDFEPEYDTVQSTDALTTALPNQPHAPTATTAANPTTTPSQTEASNVQPPTPKEPVQSGKKATYTVYRVQPGDTLMGISRKYFNGSASHYQDIMRINGLSDPTIKPGQNLKIPLSGR